MTDTESAASPSKSSAAGDLSLTTTGNSATYGGYTEAKLDEYIDVMVNRFQTPPAEARPAILQLLNRRRITALVVGDYDRAEQQDKNREVFNYTIQLEEERLSEDNRIDILFQRWQQLQRDQQTITEQWDSRITAFAKDDQVIFDKLTEDHNAERAEFDKLWQDPNTLRPFTKPSARLLQLREQERAMAVSRLYAKAKDMKAFADKIQREETDAAQERIRLQMDIDKQRMLRRQEAEISKHKVHRESVITMLDGEKQEALRPCVTAMSQIRLKKANLPKSRKSQGKGTTDAVPISARSHQMYAAFKAEKKPQLLPVRPVTAEPEKPKSTVRSSSRANRDTGGSSTAAPSEGEPPSEPAPAETNAPVELDLIQTGLQVQDDAAEPVAISEPEPAPVKSPSIPSDLATDSSPLAPPEPAHSNGDGAKTEVAPPEATDLDIIKTVVPPQGDAGQGEAALPDMLAGALHT